MSEAVIAVVFSNPVIITLAIEALFTGNFLSILQYSNT
jgi:hypothetical protein